jgi:hypothetical protein
MKRRKDFSPEFKREAVRLLDAGERGVHRQLICVTPYAEIGVATELI